MEDAAETLSDIGTEKSLAIVILLLKSGNDELVLASLDSINPSLRVARLDEDVIDELIGIIERLHASGVFKIFVLILLRLNWGILKRLNSSLGSGLAIAGASATVMVATQARWLGGSCLTLQCA